MTKTDLVLCRAAIALALAAVVSCNKDNGNENPPEKATPYVTKVFDFLPAAGQFTNELPAYEDGDTQEDMNRKALEAIGNDARGMVSLGGFGGYITVGFDHRIENRPGLCDFRVLGNAFGSSGDSRYGSSEAGVIQVSADSNGNGLPDDEWFEIAGSAHNGEQEDWYGELEESGADIRTIKGYEITYFYPESEPENATEQYIRWEDNQGGQGYISKNSSHLQPYMPKWIDSDRLTFSGTRLPQNGKDLSGNGTYFGLYRFSYGYADNAPNTDNASAIDIDWAIDMDGNPAGLEGIDFIRIYSGIRQENGWLGECSTEIMGVTDLHLSGEQIESIR